MVWIALTAFDVGLELVREGQRIGADATRSFTHEGSEKFPFRVPLAFVLRFFFLGFPVGCRACPLFQNLRDVALRLGVHNSAVDQQVFPVAPFVNLDVAGFLLAGALATALLDGYGEPCMPCRLGYNIANSIVSEDHAARAAA